MRIDEFGRPHPSGAAGEVETLRGFLDYQRATLAWKCRDVPAEGLRATTAATSMTLGGLLNHMAWVEDYWFSVMLRGEPPVEPWASADWEADHDWEWTSAATADPADLHERWQAACVRSRAAIDDALAEGGVEQPIAKAGEDGAPTVRWVLVHMIEEYARHNGHADLLREAWDGGAIGE